MSKLIQKRKKMGYETDMPRCGNCAHVKKPYVYLTTNSQTKKSPYFCKIGDFAVQLNSCCNEWCGTDGTTLLREPTHG